MSGRRKNSFTKVIHCQEIHRESTNPIEECRERNREICDRHKILSAAHFEACVERRYIKPWYCYNDKSEKLIPNPYKENNK